MSMNKTNVKASLTTTLNSSVASSDITAAPLNLPQLTESMAAQIQAAESAAAQQALDIAAANKIVTSLQGKH